MKRIRNLSEWRLISATALICVILFSAYKSQALSLPPIFGSGMVIQRNSTLNLWGWAEPGENVTVSAGWLEQPVKGLTGPDGKFRVALPTVDAGGPYAIIISGAKSEIKLDDILLGDVWVCSGQSNMDFTVNMLGGWNKTFPSGKEELLKKGFRQIRLFSVEKDTSSQYREYCKGVWQRPDTLTVSNFSATGWFFGVSLYNETGVPVGLIASAWGGTPAEAWTPRDVIDQDQALAFYRNDPNRNSWFPTNPGTLYNAMIYPLTQVPVRGAIWYQGESNVTDADTYGYLFPAMIESWRKAWHQDDLPFYYVQIAPFTYERAMVGALLREAQFRSMKVPHTGMAVTMDITGDVTDIHPKDKVSVGKRLALWALNDTYGKPQEECSGPVFRDFTVTGNAIELSFDHTTGGLKLNKRKGETGFFICGEDHHFVPARVQVEGVKLVLKSSRVNKPVAVRYGFSNTSEATLFNGKGLPASSFRTDDWPVVTDIVTMKPVYDELTNTMQYQLLCTNPAAAVSYTTDGTEPGCANAVEAGSRVVMMHPGRIIARACVNGIQSESIGSWEVFQHKGIAAKVSYAFPYSVKYAGGGDYALVDGVGSNGVFYDGAWQGFEGDDLSVVLDLGENTMIRKVLMNYYSDPNSWIFLPRYVEVSTSADGVHFEKGYRYENITGLMSHQQKPEKEIIPVRAVIMKNARYLKVVAKSIGTCPKGHQGVGEKAWLFLDEIDIE